MGHPVTHRRARRVRRAGGLRLGLGRAALKAKGLPLIVGAAMVLTSCSANTGSPGVDAFGLPIGQPITRAELSVHRESHLFYPGSQVVRSVGSNQIPRPGKGEPDPAFAGAILSAAVTADQLYAF